MNDLNHSTRRAVRNHYGSLVQSQAGTGSPDAACCGTDCCSDKAEPRDLRAVARQLGYTDADVDSLPSGETMTLGCGNPVALAALAAGETVLDLGSGAGFDSMLAADRVGPTGKVIGVDMTPPMLDRARQAAAGRANVEFRLGEIEHLPVADATVDVVLSNCVVNLSPQKEQVFAEAFRVLRPGGRLSISDTVALRDMGGSPFDSEAHISACIRGSVPVDELETLLTEAGFTGVSVVVHDRSAEVVGSWEPGSGVEDYVAAALIEARKPLR